MSAGMIACPFAALDYTGKTCSQASPCPAGWSCEDGRCARPSSADGAPPLEDGGGVDSGSTSDGALDSALEAASCPSAPDELLPSSADPGFELGCDAWRAVEIAQLSASNVARCGATSCRVCSTALFHLLSVEMQGVAGEQLRGSFFARADDADGADGGRGIAQILSGGDHYDGNAIVLTREWQRVTVVATLPETGPMTLAFKLDPSSSGTCVLVDDARLVRLADASAD
ncbi:MAG: hypothetical protein KF819_05015 [Labilithrix sp.]|nr:hypothetical protein [Labilithrix sp.]